jgi:hypothetical protein
MSEDLIEVLVILPAVAWLDVWAALVIVWIEKKTLNMIASLF